MAQNKKTPERKCLGCGEMRSKRELIKVVRSKDGKVSLDPTGKAPGRGAYICRREECLKAARKSRRFEKAFSCAISDEIYDGLERELKDGQNE